MRPQLIAIIIEHKSAHTAAGAHGEDATVASGRIHNRLALRKPEIDRSVPLRGLRLSVSETDHGQAASVFVDSHDIGRVQRREPCITHVRMQAVRLNTFFDARLTSIAAVADASKGTTVAAFPTATSALANKHAGSLQVGGYLPVILSNYFFRNHQYSLFTAPLAKFGFYQLTDSTTDASGNTTINNTSFYKFHAYGLRVGHYREYVDWQGQGNTHHSPEQLSYIDFTMGKFGNFEYVRNFVPNAAQGGACTADPVQGGTVPSCAVLRQQAWRLGVEGMLRIPFTPFILGLNANISTQRLHLPGYTAPGDDLRFLFGMRFDSRKLLNGIAKLGGN